MTLTILRVLFLRLRNNPPELLLVFVMPVVFFSIFAAIFSNGISTGSDKKLRIGWLEQSQSATGSELWEYLQNCDTLECIRLKDVGSGELLRESKKSLGERNSVHSSLQTTIESAQRSGRYDLIIQLSDSLPSEPSSTRNIENGEIFLVTDGQNPMAVSMVNSVIQGFLARQRATALTEQLKSQMQSVTRSKVMSDPVELARKASLFVDTQKSRSWFSDGSSHTTGTFSHSRAWVNEETFKDAVDVEPAEIQVSVVNPQSQSQTNPRIAMYAAGIAVLFLLFSATGNAAALLEESESGTLDRILISKASLLQIVGGKWLGIFLLGCIQISVMFLWAELIFDIHLWNHLAGFALMTACTAAATSSFAMLLATACTSRTQLNAVSVVVILSMSAVGGSMIPRFAMSDRMKEIGQWTFNAWALDGYQKVFWFHSPVSSLYLEVSVLLASAIVLGLLAMLLSLRWKVA